VTPDYLARVMELFGEFDRVPEVGFGRIVALHDH
jgi:hypothetical protein